MKPQGHAVNYKGAVPQSQPLDGRQVANNAGGFTFQACPVSSEHHDSVRFGKFFGRSVCSATSYIPVTPSAMVLQIDDMARLRRFLIIGSEVGLALHITCSTCQPYDHQDEHASHMHVKVCGRCRRYISLVSIETQGGTYYVTEQTLTLEAARGVKALLDAGHGLQVGRHPLGVRRYLTRLPCHAWSLSVCTMQFAERW
jgi:hypothetical protein